MNENELSFFVIGIALELHKNIGPGLLESAYENALTNDFRVAGLDVNSKSQCHFFTKK